MDHKTITIEDLFDSLYYTLKLRGMSLLGIMNLTAKAYVLLEEIERIGE